MTARNFECPRQLRHFAVGKTGRIDQVGERARADRVDEQTAGLAKGVIAGGAGHGQTWIQRLVDGQDLLDDDPGVRPRDLPQPAQIPRRIGQSVRVVDAQAVDQTFVEPALHLHMGGVEYRAVLLPQTGQRGDREEPPVAAYPAAPAGQTVVLTIVYLAAGARAGPRCDGIAEVAEPQYVPVDHEVVDIVVGTQDRQHDSAVVQRPVDIEK